MELDDVTQKVVKVFRRLRVREEDPSALEVAVDKKPKEDGPVMNIQWKSPPNKQTKKS